MKEKQISATQAPQTAIADKVYGGREARKSGQVVTFKLGDNDSLVCTERKMVQLYTKKEWKDYLAAHKREVIRAKNKELNVLPPDKVDGVEVIQVERPFLVLETTDGQDISLSSLSSLSSYKRFKDKFLNAESETDEPIDINPDDYLLCSGTANSVIQQVADWLNRDAESETPALTIQFMVKIKKTDLPDGFTSDVVFPVFA